jgi:hypothetical protein
MAANLYLGTLRAFAGSDNDFTVYVRDDDGPMVLSGVTTLEAVIRSRDYDLLTITATSAAPGEVSFTITSENIRKLLNRLGLFRLVVRADDSVIYTAHLEVTG